MYKFSKKSKEKLSSCHKDLQTLFKEVIKYKNCTIISGYRTPEEQQVLYAKGRTEPGGIITYKDGVRNKSKHNENPSLAVDVVPYPSLYSDEHEIEAFANYVLGIATMLKEFGYLENYIKWGGTWKWKDLPHFQIKI